MRHPRPRPGLIVGRRRLWVPSRVLVGPRWLWVVRQRRLSALLGSRSRVQHPWVLILDGPGGPGAWKVS
jgi:hypothetical protein